MKMIISNCSSVPFYEQIKSQIIAQIMNDELREDDLLPSIRTMSKGLKISLMTVKKAYDQLEAEGYIKSIAGKGTFVAPKNPELALECSRREIEDCLENAVNAAAKIGMTKSELQNLIEIIWSNFNNEKCD